MAIPGSYWGECEAGLVGCNVYARDDTPLHSVLHEASHLLVMPEARRTQVHTDATDSLAEEDAACYLQILFSQCLPGVGGARLMADMDAWGYSFRLGSASAWFERDAEDALNFLELNCPALSIARSVSGSIAPPASPGQPAPLPPAAPGVRP